jgi:hypothetical protein
MVLIDARVHSEHAQVIRSNIGPESVEKYRNVQNVPISGKKPLGPFFQTLLYYLQTEDSIFRILYKHYTLNRSESIQIHFFLCFNNYKTLEL